MLSLFNYISYKVTFELKRIILISRLKIQKSPQKTKNDPKNTKSPPPKFDKIYPAGN